MEGYDRKATCTALAGVSLLLQVIKTPALEVFGLGAPFMRSCLMKQK